MNYELLAFGIGFILMSILNGRNTAFILDRITQLREDTNQQLLHLHGSSSRSVEELTTDLKRHRAELERRFNTTDANLTKGFKEIRRTTDLHERLTRLEEQGRKKEH